MLTTIYWFCFLIGGVFVALAALGGLDELDFDAEVDALDFELEPDGLDLVPDVETDVELVDQGDGPQPRRSRHRRKTRRRISILGILTTFKFWTFGSCFFGLTGLVLSALQTGLVPVTILGIAVVMGLLCGGAIAIILQSLRYNQTDSLVRSDDLVGMTGTVELPFDATGPGKVRLSVKGTTVDFLAFTDEPTPLQQGAQVVVMGTQNNRIWVVSVETFNQQ